MKAAVRLGEEPGCPSWNRSITNISNSCFKLSKTKLNLHYTKSHNQNHGLCKTTYLFGRIMYFGFKDHLLFGGFLRTNYLCCKDHLSSCGFMRTAYLCCMDHPLFCGFMKTAYLCCNDHLLFCCLKNRAVLLKRQGGPTNMNSQNMLSNLDHPIICILSACLLI